MENMKLTLEQTLDIVKIQGGKKEKQLFSYCKNRSRIYRVKNWVTNWVT